MGFPGGASGKEPACQCRRHGRHRVRLTLGSIPGSGRFPWSRKWQPTPVWVPDLLPAWSSASLHCLSSLLGTIPFSFQKVLFFDPYCACECTGGTGFDPWGGHCPSLVRTTQLSLMLQLTRQSGAHTAFKEATASSGPWLLQRVIQSGDASVPPLWVFYPWRRNRAARL